ncbi:MAG: hypothetical protein LC802_08830 [Acidobacteria bacterium]|nr:hypothetical protein [Acidobacteriota bacterium]
MEVSNAPELDSQDEEESEDREAERDGDAAESDAPTAVEENEAMSMVLSGETLDGVQRDAGDE